MRLNFFRDIPAVAILILFAFGCNNGELKKLEDGQKTEKEQTPMKSEPLPPSHRRSKTESTLKARKNC